jgi:hypothetical protein
VVLVGVLVVLVVVLVVVVGVAVVAGVVLAWESARRSLQDGFSVVVGTKFHHFLALLGSAGVSWMSSSTDLTSANPDLLRNPGPS